MSSQTHLPPAWKARLCGLMLIPECPAVDKLLDAWERAEGGSARWNPLNTTEPMLGTTDYNSAHVKNYPSPIAGIAATALTLQLEPYHGLWGALQLAKSSGDTARELVEQHASAFNTWGTGAAHVLALLPA